MYVASLKGRSRFYYRFKTSDLATEARQQELLIMTVELG